MPSWHGCTTETQISLRIRAVWSESSLSAWRNFASLAIQAAPSEDSDQTARMRMLIGIFTGGTCPKVRFLTLWHKCMCPPWKNTELIILIRTVTVRNYPYNELFRGLVKLRRIFLCDSAGTFSYSVLHRKPMLWVLIRNHNIDFYAEMEKISQNYLQILLLNFSGFSVLQVSSSIQGSFL